MLEHTFIHLPTVGPRTEVQLWRRGILTWEDLAVHLSSWPPTPSRRLRLQEAMAAAKKMRHCPRYFHDRLPAAERWRLYPDFKRKTAFLDIETTGTDYGYSEVTVVGVYDGTCIQQFVSGLDLDRFEAAIAEYDVLVTFNGTSFDLPFLQRQFPGLRFQQAHIDLRFVVRRLGYRGGLKAIEPLFGIVRPPEIEGLGGWEAVVLWQQFCRGDTAALERLLAYNRADIVNLELILQRACELRRRDLELAAGVNLAP